MRARVFLAGVCGICLSGLCDRSSAQSEFEVTVFPNQVVAGETRKVVVKSQGIDDLQAVEIDPPEGVVVKTPRPLEQRREDVEKGKRAWELEVAVAPGTALGSRSLTLVARQGHSRPTPLHVVDHAPRIAGLRVLATRYRQELDFECNVSDSAGDLGEAPAVYATLTCGYAEAVHPAEVVGILGSVLKVAQNLSVEFGKAQGQGPGWNFAQAGNVQLTPKDATQVIARATARFKSSAEGKCILAIVVEDGHETLSEPAIAVAPF